MNDVEFVNAYVARLKATIDELLNRNIILETRLSLLEPKLQTMQEENAALVANKQVREKKEKKVEDPSTF